MRVPGLIDVVTVDTPEAVRALAQDSRLDRVYGKAGPLLNRLFAGHVRETLAHNGVPLPPVAARDTAGRLAACDALEGRLRDSKLAAAPVDALARCVSGETDELGIAAQSAIGSLFVPGYAATEETWQAALHLDGALRSRNPLNFARWWLNGRVALARSRLADACGGDLAALHATGIAVHNLVTAIERMRALAEPPGALARIAPEQAATIALKAPDDVLREATAHGTTPYGTFRRGTLVRLRLEAARARSLNAEIAFLSASWSRCPAHALVPRLLTQVWRRAQEMAA
jgi:hypothetical protein